MSFSVGRALGKRKHTPPCSSAELFFAEKKWGPTRGKISVVDMGFPGFHRVFVSTTDLESFSFEARKFPKRFFFRWGIFRIFGPNFAPNFAPNFPPNFSRTFRASCSWETETRKNSPKIPAIFSMQNSQANTKKSIHKMFLRREGKVRDFASKHKLVEPLPSGGTHPLRELSNQSGLDGTYEDDKRQKWRLKLQGRDVDMLIRGSALVGASWLPAQRGFCLQTYLKGSPS